MIDFLGVRRFHFVGIGGIGMSGLAELLVRCGMEVSGSDLEGGEIVERLRRLGVRIHLGHSNEHLGDAQAVVYSSAVSRRNPELQVAFEKGLSIISRAELLGEFLRFRRGITVSGTHGKTTITSMVGLLLKHAGLDPTVLVGAVVRDLGGNACLGAGPYVVVEADESDRGFLKLSPVFAVASNIDLDHMDSYRDLEDLKQAFGQYLNRVPFYGTAIACLDDLNLRRVLKKVHRRVLTYGLSKRADFTASGLRLRPFESSFTCLLNGQVLGSVDLSVGGRHNIQNALAAVAVGSLLNIPFKTIRDSLGQFRGAERRMQFKGERAGVRVVDDYGHHPTEIQATLEACAGAGKRLVVVFQPHRYSRTRYLMKELAASFARADLLYLMDVYAAGEKPRPGSSSERLAREVRRHRQVHHLSDSRELLKQLKSQTAPGDLLITLGAGDVWKIGERFLAG